MSDATEPQKELLALPPGVDRLSDLGTLLTVQEIAERLQVFVKAARRMVMAGKFLGDHQVPIHIWLVQQCLTGQYTTNP